MEEYVSQSSGSLSEELFRSGSASGTAPLHNSKPQDPLPLKGVISFSHLFFGFAELRAKQEPHQNSLSWETTYIIGRRRLIAKKSSDLPQGLNHLVRQNSRKNRAKLIDELRAQVGSFDTRITSTLQTNCGKLPTIWIYRAMRFSA
jgi:hypothetical protein